MKIKFTKQALADVNSIYDFIDANNTTMAKKVLFRIKNATLLIAEFPDIGRLTERKNVREVAVSKLPFVVIYKIKKKQIYILTIFHTSRNPLTKF